MFDVLFVIAIAPLLIAAVLGFLAAKSRRWIIRVGLIGFSLLPPLAEVYALIWYQRVFLTLTPMLEIKNLAIFWGIFDLQIKASPIIAASVFAIFWIRFRRRPARF